MLTFEDGSAVTSPADWTRRREELLKKWHGLLGPWPPLLEAPSAQEQFKDTVEGFSRRRLVLEAQALT